MALRIDITGPVRERVIDTETHIQKSCSQLDCGHSDGVMPPTQ